MCVGRLMCAVRLSRRLLAASASPLSHVNSVHDTTGLFSCACVRRCLTGVACRWSFVAHPHTTADCSVTSRAWQLLRVRQPSVCSAAPMSTKMAAAAAAVGDAALKKQSTASDLPRSQSKKRPHQRKRAQLNHERRKHPDLKVVAYSTAEEYDLEMVSQALKTHPAYQPLTLSEDAEDVMHVLLTPSNCSTSNTEATTPVSGMTESQHSVLHEAFLFREGTAVFWNVDKADRVAFMRLLHSFEHGGYDTLTIEAESDMMPFTYTNCGGVSRLTAGRILLDSSQLSADTARPTAADHHDNACSLALQKYAFSNALSLSVKLSVWEAALDEYTDNMRSVTDDLQKGGAIRMYKQDVLRKVGQLFSLRHSINLSSDCLDTPDFYWDRHQLEQLYQKTSNYLNIGKRTRVMNEKLNHCVELADMLSSSLQDQHHVRLEWMIIALIMIEVGFELVHFIERFT